METKFLSMNDEAALALASSLLCEGELVAIPTETVYGLAANALNADACSKIFAVKGRPADNPLIVHVASISQADTVAEVSPLAKKLWECFAPGPLTLVLPKRECVPDTVTCGLPTVAVRIPDHFFAQALLAKTGLPFAAPSANVSGRPSPTRGEHVYEDLSGRIGLVVDGGSARVGLESTVLDVTSDIPRILRPGGITFEDFAKHGFSVESATVSVVGDSPVMSPGMKYRHYAPKGELILLSAEELIKRENEADLLLISDELQDKVKCTAFLLGSKDDLTKVAQNIFTALRYADEVGAKVIFAESFPDNGIGLAIMNRLAKAASKR